MSRKARSSPCELDQEPLVLFSTVCPNSGLVSPGDLPMCEKLRSASPVIAVFCPGHEPSPSCGRLKPAQSPHQRTPQPREDAVFFCRVLAPFPCACAVLSAQHASDINRFDDAFISTGSLRRASVWWFGAESKRHCRPGRRYANERVGLWSWRRLVGSEWAAKSGRGIVQWFGRLRQSFPDGWCRSPVAVLREQGFKHGC